VLQKKTTTHKEQTERRDIENAFMEAREKKDMFSKIHPE